MPITDTPYNRTMFDEESISVRDLVGFLCRSGDLDSGMAGSSDAMQEGSQAHRRIQQQAGPDYMAEVPLKIWYDFAAKSCVLPESEDESEEAEISSPSAQDKRLLLSEEEKCLSFPDEDERLSLSEKEQHQLFSDEGELPRLLIEGRADGILYAPMPLSEKPVWTIDEIKTTYQKLRSIKEPVPVHLAQAMCYARILTENQGLNEVAVRMTYCSLPSGKSRFFYQLYTRKEIIDWFDNLMSQYERWVRIVLHWRRLRNQSIHALQFPFPYREGQKYLAGAVYHSILEGRKLFMEAPTGTGKTITTLFPSVKALGEGLADRIFYLTAKTITRTAAESTANLLREQSLRLRSVTLTAKEKICILDTPDCTPQSCPRAKGHFDRINDALFSILTEKDNEKSAPGTSADNFTRDRIRALAEQYNVCPFELSLDLSLFCDLVIGDYNYVFDPHAYLKRFFTERTASHSSVLLIDEAHNLVDRGRDMYSARLSKSDILTLRRKVKDVWPELDRKLSALCRAFSQLRRGQMNGRDKQVETARGAHASYVRLQMDDLDGLTDRIFQTLSQLEHIFKEQRAEDAGSGKVKKAEKGKPADRHEKKALQKALSDFYFLLDHYRMIYENLNDHYILYMEEKGKDVDVSLYCADPSGNLAECMSRCQSSILFSATLLPIQYYKSLLGGSREDYEIYAHSVFDPERQGIYIVQDLTSRYQERNPQMYSRIAGCILQAVRERYGNYMVFFPSFTFMENVRTNCAQKMSEENMKDVTIFSQKSGMSENDREEFLARFEKPSEDVSMIGFCVLGGIFGEGIDLRSDRLIGVFIVGTGIPMVCSERELLKEYFVQNGQNGYNYAYRFPGMNKVLQAAGRVIRTAEDVGIVVLMDERFGQRSNSCLYPREWSGIQVTDTKRLPHLLESFWNEWL